MEKKIPASLQKRMDNILEDIDSIIEEIEREGLQHTQSALNFVDELNKLSVSF